MSTAPLKSISVVCECSDDESDSSTLAQEDPPTVPGLHRPPVPPPSQRSACAALAGDNFVYSCVYLTLVRAATV